MQIYERENISQWRRKSIDAKIYFKAVEDHQKQLFKENLKKLQAENQRCLKINGRMTMQTFNSIMDAYANQQSQQNYKYQRGKRYTNSTHAASPRSTLRSSQDHRQTTKSKMIPNKRASLDVLVFNKADVRYSQRAIPSSLKSSTQNERYNSQTIFRKQHKLYGKTPVIPKNDDFKIKFPQFIQSDENGEYNDFEASLKQTNDDLNEILMEAENIQSNQYQSSALRTKETKMDKNSAIDFNQNSNSNRNHLLTEPDENPQPMSKLSLTLRNELKLMNYSKDNQKESQKSSKKKANQEKLNDLIKLINQNNRMLNDIDTPLDIRRKLQSRVKDMLIVRPRANLRNEPHISNNKYIYLTKRSTVLPSIIDLE